jgi:hypothetical protein
MFQAACNKKVFTYSTNSLLIIDHCRPKRESFGFLKVLSDKHFIGFWGPNDFRGFSGL